MNEKQQPRQPPPSPSPPLLPLPLNSNKIFVASKANAAHFKWMNEWMIEVKKKRCGKNNKSWKCALTRLLFIRWIAPEICSLSLCLSPLTHIIKIYVLSRANTKRAKIPTQKLADDRTKLAAEICVCVLNSSNVKARTKKTHTHTHLEWNRIKHVCGWSIAWFQKCFVSQKCDGSSNKKRHKMKFPQKTHAFKR